MTAALTISSSDGSIRIAGCPLVLAKGLRKDVAVAHLSQFHRSNTDHGYGYEWLYFQGTSFGMQPCALGLCFHLDHLTAMQFGVSLPNAVLEDGWPTRETIDQEISFIRKQLAKQLGRTFESGQERFSWGVVWSLFDAKGVQASAGLRYEL
ncbi:hypothetical protein [Peristeroidobacter agariperforans]|uniref:hypothetical protein n=1 Tax=Peristeroidobacter agariperforans TaxID=268404 RepID=UPI00101DBF25|nr:hypothetical protein [Peristeroidobacter agariperforans]